MTESRPVRVPAADGVNWRVTTQVLPAASVAGQVLAVKSPETAVLRAKSVAPAFFRVTDCASVETVVTVTGLTKVTDVGETVRLGLVEVPGDGGRLQGLAVDDDGQAVVECDGGGVRRREGERVVGNADAADRLRRERRRAGVVQLERRSCGQRDGGVSLRHVAAVGKIEIARDAETTVVLAAKADVRRRNGERRGLHVTGDGDLARADGPRGGEGHIGGGVGGGGEVEDDVADRVGRDNFMHVVAKRDAVARLMIFR